MRVEFRSVLVTAIVVVLFWALVMMASAEAMPGYISTVEIHVDGFVCATCVRNTERTLKQEEGVAEVTGDWEKGIVAVIPDQDIGWVNLFDFAQRINSSRNYTVINMDVVGSEEFVYFVKRVEKERRASKGQRARGTYSHPRILLVGRIEGGVRIPEQLVQIQ